VGRSARRALWDAGGRPCRAGEGARVFLFSEEPVQERQGPAREAGRPALRGRRHAAWWESYLALAGIEGEDTKAAGTFATLIGEYKLSPEWAALSEDTIVQWTRHLAYVKEKWVHLRVTATEPRHVLALRDAFADIPPADRNKHTKPLEDYENRPAAANNLLRALSSTMTWSVPRGWIAANPCMGVKKLKGDKPYEPWKLGGHLPLREGGARGPVARGGAGAVHGAALRRRHPDALDRHAREHDRGGAGQDRQEALDPDAQGTQACLEGCAPDERLHSDQHARDGLDEQKCVFHGLRKSAVVMLLEAGCTDAEVSAITGQSREMVEHYALQVNEKKLAAAAILKWEALHRREGLRRKRPDRVKRAEREPVAV
jgi:hypothetical protein